MDIRGFQTDKESSSFCSKIADEMISQFHIARVEALERINEHWKGILFVGAEHVLYHEGEDEWARDIYFGKDSFWWKSPEERAEMGLPALEPKDIKRKPHNTYKAP